jgi:hypothetical protein
LGCRSDSKRRRFSIAHGDLHDLATRPVDASLDLVFTRVDSNLDRFAACQTAPLHAVDKDLVAARSSAKRTRDPQDGYRGHEVRLPGSLTAQTSATAADSAQSLRRAIELIWSQLR